MVRWKENSSSFPLIAKAANIVLATPASEAICLRLFKRAKHIGTTDQIARPRDETFEMLVIAQYNLARHGTGGLEAIEVSMIIMSFLDYSLLSFPLLYQGSPESKSAAPLHVQAVLDQPRPPETLSRLLSVFCMHSRGSSACCLY